MDFLSFETKSLKDELMSLLFHPDLLAAQKLAYEPSDLLIDRFIKESESEAYGASEFEINHRKVKFRVAKITSTKIGQFVTLWKRNEKGTIQPLEMEDPFDFVVISVRNGERFGQFIFPKTALFEKGIVSRNGTGGKLAIRVYPSWDITESNQAKNTQMWQLLYFLEMSSNTKMDAFCIRKLFLL